MSRPDKEIRPSRRKEFSAGADSTNTQERVAAPIVSRSPGPVETDAVAVVNEWITDVEFTPKQVVQAWVRGLKEFGATGVRVAYLHRIPLPKVVELDCPFWHDGPIVGTFAKVRLLVEDAGWVSHFEGLVLDADGPPKFGTSSCTQCSRDERFMKWLLTCPACAADAPLDVHPEHAPLYCELGPDEPWRPSLDGSPFARVLDAISAPVTPSKGQSVSRKRWTPESASDWLDGLERDGEQLVPTSMGQRAAWDAVRDLEGRPPQSLVREGQALRKARS